MISIPIFQQEIDDGISTNVASNASVSYLTLVEKFEPDNTLRKVMASRLKAKNHLIVSTKSDPDLYYVKSILVTASSNTDMVGWNKNSDVFDAQTVWAARHTPEDKPTNLEHDENKIIGHMTDCWAIDNNNNIISDDTAVDQIPEVLHIVNGSVIYLRWTDSELQAQAAKLIQQIEAKTKFVSMECLFSNFDYAIKTKSGYEVQERTADSAYLTKHLRQYGGSGEYNGKQIGRLLRNIMFCGKGFVDSPANPESVILGKDVSNGVLNYTDNITWTYNTDSIIMKENIPMATDDKTNDQIAGLKTEIKDLQKQLADANVDSFKKTISELEADISNMETNVSEKETVLAEKETALTEKDVAIGKLNDIATELKAKIEELTKSNTDMQKELDIAKELELVAKRVNVLVSGGISNEKAIEDVEKFKGLDDDQFAVVAEALIAAVPSVDTDDTDDSSDADTTEADDDTDDNVDNADADLDDVETDDEPDLSAADAGTDDMDAIRQELQDFVRGRLSTKGTKGTENTED